MPTIYFNARNVIVWLGRRGLDSDLVIKMLNDRGFKEQGASLQALRDGEYSRLFIDYPAESLDFETDVPGYERLVEELEDQRATIWELCKRPYWKRVWIVQEILKARRLVFICGQQYFSWNQIRQLVADAEGASSSHEVSWFHDAFFATPAGKLLRWKRRWENSRRVRGSEPSYRLDNLMEDFAHQGSQDPRDRVFALVGLAKITFSSHDLLTLSRHDLPVADYSKSQEQVFSEVMSYIYDTPDRKDLINLWKFVMLAQRTLEIDDSYERVHAAKRNVLRRNIDSAMLYSVNSTTNFLESYVEAHLAMRHGSPNHSKIIEDVLAFISGISWRPRHALVLPIPSREPMFWPGANTKRRLEQEEVIRKKSRDGERDTNKTYKQTQRGIPFILAFHAMGEPESFKRHSSSFPSSHHGHRTASIKLPIRISQNTSVLSS
jgi:hypothetical protein